MLTFSLLDYLIFFLLFFLTLFVVFWGSRRSPSHPSILDHMLMGRQLTLPLFVGTLVATWYGNILGVTQIAFEQGVYNFITQGLFWYLTYILFACFLVKKIRSYGTLSLATMTESMFGPRAKVVTAIFTFFDMLPIAYVLSLGLLLQLCFGGSLLINTSCGLGAVLLYSLFGGFRSIVLSDFVQFLTMLLSVAVVFFFSCHTYGGLSFLQQELPSHYFSPTGNQSLSSTLVWGFIALGTLVNPTFYQRCFAANSTKTARYGILLSTLIWVAFDLMVTLGAMYARAALPEAPSNQAYLLYANALLPPGFRGLVLAGITATILSTLDSYLFIAASILSYDLAPKKWIHRRYLHQLAILAVGLLALALSSCFDGNIRAICKLLGSYSTAGLLLPITIGHLFPGRVSDKLFAFAATSSAVVISGWHFSARSTALSIDAFYVGCAVTSLILLIGIIGQRKSS